MRTVPVLLVMLVSLAAAGCGGDRARTTPTVSRPAAAPPTAATTPPAQADSVWAKATGSGAIATSNVGVDGNGKTVTRLIAVDARTQATRAIRYVDGSWDLPAPVDGGDLEGIAWDGSLAVMQSTDDPSRLVAVHLLGPARVRAIDLRAQGRFGYDTLSPDGNTLFLTQYRDASGGVVDRIRAYDLRTGILAQQPVVDKLEGGETMAGTPVARARSAAGTEVYTVYEAAPRPFIHVLLTEAAASFCLDLPAAGRPRAPGNWTLTISRDAHTLTASSQRLGKTFVAEFVDGLPKLTHVTALSPGTAAS